MVVILNSKSTAQDCDLYDFNPQKLTIVNVIEFEKNNSPENINTGVRFFFFFKKIPIIYLTFEF